MYNSFEWYFGVCNLFRGVCVSLGGDARRQDISLTGRVSHKENWKLRVYFRARNAHYFEETVVFARARIYPLFHNGGSL